MAAQLHVLKPPPLAPSTTLSILAQGQAQKLCGSHYKQVSLSRRQGQYASPAYRNKRSSTKGPTRQCCCRQGNSQTSGAGSSEGFRRDLSSASEECTSGRATGLSNRGSQEKDRHRKVSLQHLSRRRLLLGAGVFGLLSALQGRAYAEEVVAVEGPLDSGAPGQEKRLSATSNNADDSRENVVSDVEDREFSFDPILTTATGPASLSKTTVADATVAPTVVGTVAVPAMLESGVTAGLAAAATAASPATFAAAALPAAGATAASSATLTSSAAVLPAAVGSTAAASTGVAIAHSAVASATSLPSASVTTAVAASATLAPATLSIASHAASASSGASLLCPTSLATGELASTAMAATSLELGVGAAAVESAALVHSSVASSSLVGSAVANTAHHFVNSGVAGAVGAAAVAPIDTVKTRMQAQQRQENGDLEYSNPIDCVQKIIKEEGPGALYAGLLPQLVGVAPEKAVKLTVNEMLLGTLERYIPGARLWALELVAGGGGGLCQVIFTNPMEIVKIRLQTQQHSAETGGRTKGTWDVVRELGFRGLYQGSTATLLREIPSSAIFFCCYVLLKQVYPDSSFMAGFLAAVPSAFLVTPMDVIKTRLQVETKPGEAPKYSGAMDCLQKIVKEEGPLALFKGGLTRVLRVSPQFGVTLAIYEVLNRGS